jgi:proprotein convertase subtilisin/kexin type 5
VASCLGNQFTLSSDCTDCPTGCAACTGNAVTGGSGTQCTACSGTYYLQHGTTTCSVGCTTGYYNGTGADANKCLQCDSTCASCTDGTTQCTTCASGTPLKQTDGTCVASCLGNQFTLSSNCVNCPPSCSTCTGPGVDGDGNANQCQSCQNDGDSDYYLQQGTTTCSRTACLGTQFVATGNVCTNCPTGCAALHWKRGNWWIWDTMHSLLWDILPPAWHHHVLCGMHNRILQRNRSGCEQMPSV